MVAHICTVKRSDVHVLVHVHFLSSFLIAIKPVTSRVAHYLDAISILFYSNNKLITYIRHIFIYSLCSVQPSWVMKSKHSQFINICSFKISQGNIMNKYLFTQLYCLERDNSVVFGQFLQLFKRAVGRLLAYISSTISTLLLEQGTVILLSSVRSLSKVEIHKSAVLGGHNNLACFV